MGGPALYVYIETTSISDSSVAYFIFPLSNLLICLHSVQLFSNTSSRHPGFIHEPSLSLYCVSNGSLFCSTPLNPFIIPAAALVHALIHFCPDYTFNFHMVPISSLTLFSPRIFIKHKSGLLLTCLFACPVDIL